MIAVPLNSGLVTLVDNCDASVLRYRWRLWERTRTRQQYAWSRSQPTRGWMIHRFILKEILEPGLVVDHKNRNGLDNRRSNLRVCTQPFNMANSGPRTGRFKGVHKARKYKTEIWVASICQREIGRFRSEVEAAEAYNEKALALWGDFAYLNNLSGVEKGEEGK